MFELLIVLVAIGIIIFWVVHRLREWGESHLEIDPDFEIDVEEDPWPETEEAASPPAVQPDYDTAIRDTIQRKGRLWLRYADAEGVISTRYIAPYSWDGVIMGAYCFGVQGPRKFRGDRIMELKE